MKTGFVVVNRAGCLFQKPVNAGLTWVHPNSTPHCDPEVFESQEAAQRVADITIGGASVLPLESVVSFQDIEAVNQLYKAVLVATLDQNIVRFLAEKDPMALRQLNDAKSQWEARLAKMNDDAGFHKRQQPTPETYVG